MTKTKLLLSLLVLLMLSVGFLPTSTAQNDPASNLLEVAVAAINQTIPGVGRPATWTFEIIYPTNSNLGCDLVSGETIEQVQVYVFSLEYASGQTYLVHVASASSYVVCSSVQAPPATAPANTSATCTSDALAFSRLSVGAFATTSVEGVAVRAPELGSAIVTNLPQGTSVNILAGPDCVGTQLAWFVDYGGARGYIVEVDYTNAANPFRALTPAAPPIPESSSYITQTCPTDYAAAGYLVPRLTIGSIGFVEPGGVNNNVRESYGISSTYVGEMTPGTEFTVIAGPECTGANTSSPIVWWEVFAPSLNLRGWTAESMGGEYFVAPIGVPVDPEVSAPNPLISQAPSTVLPEQRIAITRDNAAQLIPATALFFDDVRRADSTAEGQLFLEVSGGGGSNLLIYENLAGAELSPTTEFLLPNTLSYLGANQNGIAAIYDSTRRELNFVEITTDTIVATRTFEEIGAPQVLTFSADGSTAAYTIPSATDPEKAALEVIKLSDQRYFRMGLEQAYGDVALNADGTLVAASGLLGQVYLYDPLTSQQIGIIATSAGDFPQVAISPDGLKLAVIGLAGTGEIFDLVSRNRLTSLANTGSISSMEIYDALFSPDGSMIVFAGGLMPAATNTNPSPVLFYDATSGALVASIAGSPINTGLAFSADGTLLMTYGEFDIQFLALP